MTDLRNRTAIVTGATRGIGKATAVRLGGAGASVVVNYRDVRDEAADEAASVVKEVTEAGGRAVAASADVSALAGVRHLYDVAEDSFGGADIVVNNAAIFAAAPIQYISEEDFDRLVTVNLKSVFFAGQQAVERLRDGGRVINVSAGLPSGGIAFMGAYGATKVGVETLTRSLAHSLGSRSITVNAIAPGPTDTQMLAPEARQQLDAMLAQTPLGRLGQPADHADVITFLASEHARWVTGQVIAVNGGFE